MPRAMAAANAIAVAIQEMRSRVFRRIATDMGTPTLDPPSAIHCSSDITSLALCQRSSGSFSRHFRTTWSRAGGHIGCTVEIGAGCEDTMAAIRLVGSCPRRPSAPWPSRGGRRPARRCRSARRPPGPRAARAPCTGTSPGSCPCSVSGLSRRGQCRDLGGGAGVARLSPGRSRGAWRPDFVSMMLPGFRSR